MKINKVKLYNFSSYEGNNEFDFEITDAEKNIVLIGGKNGAGKTSLFTAIKVALYGPLAYGYVGVNSHYISKIKDLINSKAFQQEIVESEVQITLQLKIERDIRNYVITRKWDYTNQRLTEEYTVERDGKQLNDQELSYFENYLRSIIPPDLFEFFLFDGEEVGNIFSTSAYNTYVRNAVFTMCGMDVFEIIRKFTRGYVTRNNSIDDDEAYDTYESAKQQMELLETEKENLESEVSNLTKELEDIEVQLTELTTAFKNAGGISRKEKKQLEDEFNQAEKVKTESIRKKLEKAIVQKLKSIYRKNNLITHIEIGNNFDFNLYQDEEYNGKEILTLYKNLGNSEFTNLIGTKGEKRLVKMLNGTSINVLKNKSEVELGREPIQLYKKIELGRLSKGERQIFILALYWAIIEISGQNIPFIIDTPYARIDANHRREISEKFFPNISDQVIILSTDEEINEEYYKIIKPYISKEYLLINDENENRTTIENNYFFEV